MALPLPTPQEFNQYKEGLTEADALQRSADLFTIATGLSDEPTDALEARLVRTAILDMAWFLQVDSEEEARIKGWSGITSETIGSYSYSKVAKSIQDGHGSGVPGFDQAVNYFKDKFGEPGVWFSTEHVFTQGYDSYGRETVTYPDPSYTFTPEPIPFPDPQSPNPQPSPGDIVFDEDGNPEIVGP